jgi:general secretion pathway protein E
VNLEELSKELGLTYLESIEAKEIDPSLLGHIPLSFAREYKTIPLKKENGYITVLTSNPLNTHPLDDLRLLLGAKVKVVVSPEAEILRLINEYYHPDGHTVRGVIRDLNENGIQIFQDIEEPSDDLLDLANKPPIIKLVNLMLLQAVKERASDIHIEPFEKELRVRFRIDGVLYDTLAPQKRYQSAIVSRVKVMSNLNIAEHRLPQDGRITIKIGDKDIDIRVSIVPTSFGERVVMRLLDKSSAFFRLEDLGLSSERLEEIDRLIHSSHGMVLVTGPTGSGKTTTLYSALDRINSLEKNIITIEDPVEYQLKGIGQIQVNPKVGLSFANGLRSIIRQDPDIIMVGEIRDRETAEIAIHAALTGHLVFSTLHTNDAAGAVTRLLDMGIEPYLISSSVIAIIAQRLVRLICPHCRETYHPEEESLREVGLLLEDLKEGILSRGVGCEKCLDSGYRGRTGIFELLPIDEEIRHLICNRAEAALIKKKAQEKGMITLCEDGARKVREGITTTEEVLRVTR